MDILIYFKSTKGIPFNIIGKTTESKFSHLPLHFFRISNSTKGTPAAHPPTHTPLPTPPTHVPTEVWEVDGWLGKLAGGTGGIFRSMVVCLIIKKSCKNHLGKPS